MSTVTAQVRNERRIRRLMNLPRQVAGTMLAVAGLMIALSMPTSCHGQAAAGFAAIAPQSPGSWAPTGSLNTPRSEHSATLLANGKVLIVGGTSNNGGNTLDSAELYDPIAGTWSVTGRLSAARGGHTATLLSNGQVLVAGGYNRDNNDFNLLDSVELYDPSTGIWRPTANMALARTSHTATLLSTGRVLVAGGSVGVVSTSKAELYDPVEGTWSGTGDLAVPRGSHRATLLQDGRVLIGGGLTNTVAFSHLSTAEMYDPVSGRWSTTGSLNDVANFDTATLLSSGMVLATGGAVAELFDPAAGQWSFTGSLNPTPFFATASLLTDGKVLVAGGIPFQGDSESNYAQVYDSSTATWEYTGSLNVGRFRHTATLLFNGQVLVAGGYVAGPSASVAIGSAELYGSGASQPGAIGPGFTGAWYDPAQSGHGIFLEILPNNSAFIGWFSFDPAGTQQVWFGGVGSYSGNTVTFNAVDMPTGGRWIPNFDPARIVHNAWGTLKLTFTDADHGRADFNSVLGYGSGSMTLVRLTRPLGFSPLETSIGHPVAVAADSAGNVYFNSPNVVFKLDNQGTLTRVAGSLTAGYRGDGGLATQALLNFPSFYPELIADPTDWSEFAAGLTLDATGNLYIADSYNHRVRKVDPNGIITTIAGDGNKSQSGDGGPASSAEVGWPQGVAVDAAGNLYISAWSGLRKVTTAGIITSPVGIQRCGFEGRYSCVDEGIVGDGNGNVYGASLNCVVRQLKPDGSVALVAGRDFDPGTGFHCGFSGDGGPATSATLNSPYGVATDNLGNLYIADTYNSRIRKVDASGTISTIAGGSNEGFSGDGGQATNALLDHPHGVAYAAGNLYIADTNNNRIRKISTNGIITTVAGNGPDLTFPSALGRVGTGYTGAWYDPAQSGHGIFLEILPGNSVFLGWFTFNPAGTQQVWFGGVGSYSGNTITISAVDQPTGGRWIPNFNPAQIVHNAWGSMTLTFTDCNQGRVDFNSTSGYGIGSMNLVRLTQPAGTSCP